MQFLYYVLFSAAIVAADQFTKYLTVTNIALYEDVSFIPGIVQLTYVRNTGAAFSSFEGQQWLFALIFLVFTATIIYEYIKKSMPFTPFERWLIAAIYAESSSTRFPAAEDETNVMTGTTAQKYGVDGQLMH